MELILKKTGGRNLADADARWLAPNAFHTIIKQPSVYVNGTPTTEQTDTYAYKAYLETILNYRTEDEETILKPEGYYSALNHPLYTLIANQINKTHNDYKASTSELCSFEATDAFNGRVPDRVVVGKVYQDTFTGKHAYNPFNFKKDKITNMKQVMEGEEYPYLPLELHGADSELDMSGYHRLLHARGAKNRGKCMIKPEHWGEDIHTTLFMWDNVASGCADSVQLNPKQEGRVKISFRKTAVDHLLVVIIYGEFENMMQIKPTGSTQYDIYSQSLAGRIQ